jgi:hypothetical protein
MGDEAMVTNGDKFANETVRWNPAALTNLCSFLDFNERPDKAPIRDCAAVQVDPAE